MSQESFEECSIDGFKKAFDPLEKAIVVYTQPGCPHCAQAMEILKTVSEQAKTPLAEISLADDRCNSLADLHQVEVIPTILLVSKGEIKEKLTFASMTPRQASEMVLEKIQKLQPAPAPGESK